MIDHVIAVVPAGKSLARKMSYAVLENSRSLSVYNGLKAAKHLSPEKVLIHDVARPAVSESIITDVISAINEKLAPLGLAITDAIWKVSNGKIRKLSIEILYFEPKLLKVFLSKNT